MSRIDYSKWDKLNYSSSSSEEDDDEQESEKEKTQNARATVAYLEICCKNLSLAASSSSSPLWNGLVLHHKDVFVSHVLPKLNDTDRFFFQKVNRESRDVLAYAGINVSILVFAVHECSSISTLEWMWNHTFWGTVVDQA